MAHHDTGDVGYSGYPGGVGKRTWEFGDPRGIEDWSPRVAAAAAAAYFHRPLALDEAGFVGGSEVRAAAPSRYQDHP